MSDTVHIETSKDEESLLAGILASEAVTPVIRLEQVHKVYRMGNVEVHALRGVSLVVNRGEFVAVMGPSGSGKSTAMNIMGCLDHPTRGRYLLNGLDVSTVPRAELADIRNRFAGFVFQSFNLLPRTTVLENVELPMVYAGITAQERVARAREALSVVGLVGKERNLPNQLSGGEQQRTAIARALVNRPSIILADEPTGNLDTRTSVELMEVFQQLNRERKLTIVLVTHEPDIADFAERVIVFRDGRIRRDFRVDNRKMAAEVLAQVPPEGEEEDGDGI